MGGEGSSTTSSAAPAGENEGIWVGGDVASHHHHRFVGNGVGIWVLGENVGDIVGPDVDGCGCAFGLREGRKNGSSVGAVVLVVAVGFCSNPASASPGSNLHFALVFQQALKSLIFVHREENQHPNPDPGPAHTDNHRKTRCRDHLWQSDL